MKNKNNRPVLAAGISCALFAFLCAACSSEELETSGAGTPDAPVRIASVTEVLRGGATKSASGVAPADGTYYLGYKTEVGGAVTFPVHAIGLTGGTIAETGLYWVSIWHEQNGKAQFTLSNVGETEQKEPVFPEGNDILWDSYPAWMAPLMFALSHRMAEVEVTLELDLPTSAAVEQVSIGAVLQEFTFDRQQGEVTPGASASELVLDAVPGVPDGTGWRALVPPQHRTDEMELRVTTLDGSVRRVYKRKLPYSMIESIGSGQSQSIPLVFRAGYRLALTAKVTDNTDYTVFFSGATLTDWTYEGSHSVVAKPAGIYTETELKDWTRKYNAYQADKSEKNRKALLRYGTPDSGEKWTFTVSRNITVTDKSDLEPITVFYDSLEQLKDYRLKGIVQADLIAGLRPGANVDSTLFD